MAAEPVKLAAGDVPWERFFAAFPLVLVGTREPDGRHDLAPKHVAFPVSTGRWFAFGCTPRHATWRNAVRTGVFTVSYPRPDQVVGTSLAAAPRQGDDKPSLVALPVIPARVVDGVLVEGAVAHLECTLDRVVDGLDDGGLLLGRVVAAHVHPDALRTRDRDDNDLIRDQPLIVYLHPGRFAAIEHSHAFPFPMGFHR